jgi:hypothetical protein
VVKGAIRSILFCTMVAAQGKPAANIISSTGNHYYRPDDFANVPVKIRKELNKRRCLIPQDSETNGMINIVPGEFVRSGQTDWAAYCSVDGKSNVVVIWGGVAKCAGEPFGFDKPLQDDAVYKNADPQQMGRAPARGVYWRLETIPQSQVVAAEKRRILLNPGKSLSSPKHDALQRSSVMGVDGTYCVNGKWKGLWYAD